MKNLLLLFLFALSGTALSQNLEQLLFELPDASFKEIKSPDGFEAAYELSIKQPLDHKDPSKGHFHQKVFLSHRGFESPTTLITEGYQRPWNRIYELTELLVSNQVQVEHRYYGTSLQIPWTILI